MTDKEQGSYVAEEYRKTLDLGSAVTKWNDHVAEQQRIAQMQAEAEARRAQQEAARKAAEEARKAVAQKHEESSVTTEKPADTQENKPQEVATQPAEKQILYWCEFKVVDATKEQLVQLMNAMNQIGIVPNKHWMENGSPAGEAHWHLISKGNNGGNENAQK